MKKGFIVISTLLSMCATLISENIFSLGNIDNNNGTIEIFINTDSDFMGFQLDVAGIDLTGGSGGAAADAGFDVYASGDTALGFSLEGNVIPAGTNGLLTILEGTINGDVCLPFVQNVGPEDDTPILSDIDGNAIIDLSVNEGNCDALNIENDITFSILETYPNPFNPDLNIDIVIENSGLLNVAIYNLNGQLIETIYNEYAHANQLYNLKWNAASNVSSGIYIVKAVAPNNQFSSIVNLLK
tara:strand:- start:6535 stop:7260 length:726 start_codon:yes stop_codon:yes gene_type:complete